MRMLGPPRLTPAPPPRLARPPPPPSTPPPARKPPLRRRCLPTPYSILAINPPPPITDGPLPPPPAPLLCSHFPTGPRPQPPSPLASTPPALPNATLSASPDLPTSPLYPFRHSRFHWRHILSRFPRPPPPSTPPASQGRADPQPPKPLNPHRWRDAPIAPLRQPPTDDRSPTGATSPTDKGLTAWVSRAARPSLTQPPVPKSTTASAILLAAAEGGVGFTQC
jgi:hypothetical protein